MTLDAELDAFALDNGRFTALTTTRHPGSCHFPIARARLYRVKARMTSLDTRLGLVHTGKGSRPAESVPSVQE